MNDSITYTQSGAEGLDEISGLWRKLIRHHAELSPYFGDDIGSIPWETRKRDLAGKAKNGLILVQAAREDNRLIGYCVSSVTGGKTGEIDSIFIEESYRRRHIGDHFMKTAVNWMDKHNAVVKSIGVAFGNEAVFRFYSKYNFYPRSVIMRQK